MHRMLSGILKLWMQKICVCEREKKTFWFSAFSGYTFYIHVVSLLSMVIFFSRRFLKRHTQISSARATACYVTGKQTVAVWWPDWLPSHCSSAMRKISGPGPGNKSHGASTLCVFACLCMCVAVTAHWYKCLCASAGSLHQTGTEWEKKNCHLRGPF